jgi:hypothetical protein
VKTNADGQPGATPVAQATTPAAVATLSPASTPKNALSTPSPSLSRDDRETSHMSLNEIVWYVSPPVQSDFMRLFDACKTSGARISVGLRHRWVVFPWMETMRPDRKKVQVILTGITPCKTLEESW